MRGIVGSLGWLEMRCRAGWVDGRGGTALRWREVWRMYRWTCIVISFESLNQNLRVEVVLWRCKVVGKLRLLVILANDKLDGGVNTEIGPWATLSGPTEAMQLTLSYQNH
jgi:hypothetical protein